MEPGRRPGVGNEHRGAPGVSSRGGRLHDRPSLGTGLADHASGSLDGISGANSVNCCSETGDGSGHETLEVLELGFMPSANTKFSRPVFIVLIFMAPLAPR